MMQNSLDFKKVSKQDFKKKFLAALDFQQPHQGLHKVNIHSIVLLFYAKVWGECSSEYL